MTGRGTVRIHCGDGKGKTTAAVGLCVQAAGRGKRVLLVQFLKNHATGELAPLAELGVQILRGKEGSAFSFRMTQEQKRASRELHDRNLARALELAHGGGVDLLVLDEAVGALNRGLLDPELLRRVLDQRPEGMDLVLTGRNPPDWLVWAADEAWEFRMEKHPYERGVSARVGIEK